MKVISPPGYKHGDVVTTIDQWELHALRGITLEWTKFTEFVRSHRERVAQRTDSQGPVGVGITFIRESLKAADHTYIETIMIPESILGLEIPNGPSQG